MDNKLSELSKPVMYVVRTLDGSVASVKNYKYTAPKGFTSAPLYSQEYVSALLAELEAKDSEIEAANARVDVMCAKAMNLTERAETAEQRIAELEAIRSDASQVFKEIGNELGCNPDNESIMVAIDALKERLATPVRLSDSTHPRCRLQHADDIRTAGFKCVGDE